jgi:hypothetical protein
MVLIEKLDFFTAIKLFIQHSINNELVPNPNLNSGKISADSSNGQALHFGCPLELMIHSFISKPV